MSYEKNIRSITPYTPGEQPKGGHIIKLNTNECPYPPSPKVEEALRSLEADSLRLYPDPEASELKDALGKTYGLPTSRIFVGVGSDEVLALAFQTFFAGKDPILFPDITYSFYPVWAELYGISYQKIPLVKEVPRAAAGSEQTGAALKDTDRQTEAFRINAGDYKIPNGGIILPNPNAPTGVLEPLDILEELLKANPESVVIIDEAYIDFAAESAEEVKNGVRASALPLIGKYENLLVVQTFSKSRAMAGMRIGMAFGQEKLIRYLSDVKYSFNSYTMSRAAIRLGAASLSDPGYFAETTMKLVETRERSKERLRNMGWSFPDSRANFIFAKPPKKNAKEIFEKLKERGIYVRYFSAPETAEYLRITVGTDREMDELFKNLEEIEQNA